MTRVARAEYILGGVNNVQVSVEGHSLEQFMSPLRKLVFQALNFRWIGSSFIRVKWASITTILIFCLE